MLLAQHQSNPSYGHLEVAHYVTKYLVSTKTLGIYVTSRKRSTLELFLHFLVPSHFVLMPDANWGPQDVSQAKSPTELPWFVSQSMSTFYIDLLGPVHWLSKQQTVTAGSSAEAERYATNECVKFLFELVQILDFLNVRHIFMLDVNIIYNDNCLCRLV